MCLRYPTLGLHTSDTFCLLARFFDNMKVSQLSHVSSDRQNSGILFKTYLIVVTVYFHVDLQPHPSRRSVTMIPGVNA